jgi:hypothetical protein
MVLMVTVACTLAAEVVTLHTTSKTFTSADRCYVDYFARCKKISCDLLSDNEAIDRVEA